MKEEINPLNGELMTSDLDHLKKRRQEIDEMIERIEHVNNAISLNEKLQSAKDYDIEISYRNSDFIGIVKAKYIKILVD